MVIHAIAKFPLIWGCYRLAFRVDPQALPGE